MLNEHKHDTKFTKVKQWYRINYNINEEVVEFQTTDSYKTHSHFNSRIKFHMYINKKVKC